MATVSVLIQTRFHLNAPTVDKGGAHFDVFGCGSARMGPQNLVWIAFEVAESGVRQSTSWRQSTPGRLQIMASIDSRSPSSVMYVERCTQAEE